MLTLPTLDILRAATLSAPLFTPLMRRLLLIVSISWPRLRYEDYYDYAITSHFIYAGHCH